MKLTLTGSEVVEIIRGLEMSQSAAIINKLNNYLHTEVVLSEAVEPKADPKPKPKPVPVPPVPAPIPPSYAHTNLRTLADKNVSLPVTLDDRSGNAIYDQYRKRALSDTFLAVCQEGCGLTSSADGTITVVGTSSIAVTATMGGRQQPTLWGLSPMESVKLARTLLIHASRVFDKEENS